MKKTICVILAALMILSCISMATVSAAESTTIKLNGTDYNYSVGSPITYECKLKYTADVIENGQFTLNYPGSVLEITSVEFPVVANVMFNYKENLENQLKFNFSNINPGYDFKSDVVLVKVGFNVTKAGSGEISLDKEVLSNIGDKDVISSSTFTESLTKSNVVNDTTCKHTTTKTVGAKKATYFAKGYTGDKVCTSCNAVIVKGKEISKLKLAKPKMKATPAKKSIKVKYTKVKGATGFQVSYTLKNKTKTKKFDTKKTTTKKITNLKKGKTYSVKIRAYVKSGKKYAYSSWTKAKKVKVK